jgi:hypothetical protein
MKPESKRRLEDFVERAELIQTYSYFNNREKIVGFNIHKDQDQWQVDFFQPNREQTDSLLFNLRLFVQNKDDISIMRMGELCDDPGVSEKWKSEYSSIRTYLNIRLDEIAVEGSKGKLTHGELFRMVLFGELGHRSEKDKEYKRFQKWVTNEHVQAIIYNTFQVVLIWISTAVINIGKASREELLREMKDLRLD